MRRTAVARTDPVTGDTVLAGKRTLLVRCPLMDLTQVPVAMSTESGVRSAANSASLCVCDPEFS